MNREEFAQIMGRVQVAGINLATLLVDKTPRTLLYGYDFNRNTVHTYLRDDGSIESVTYDSYKNMISYCDDLGDNSKLVPSKRVYPQDSDFEFCSLLQRLGIDIPFTIYEDENECKKSAFKGSIADNLFSVNDDIFNFSVKYDLADVETLLNDAESFEKEDRPIRGSLTNAMGYYCRERVFGRSDAVQHRRDPSLWIFNSIEFDPDVYSLHSAEADRIRSGLVDEAVKICEARLTLHAAEIAEGVKPGAALEKIRSERQPQTEVLRSSQVEVPRG